MAGEQGVFAPTRRQLFAPNILHFGLGTAESVDRLTIRWLSGKVQKLRDVRADRHIVVDEDGGIMEIVAPGQTIRP